MGACWQYTAKALEGTDSAGRDSCTINCPLANGNIRQIKVDREIGITLVAFKQMKTIVLGYYNYPLKFNMLKDILSYGKHRRRFPEFDRIDLNNVNRIVVNPVSKIPTGDHKEV